jgi:hypothetical protein
VVGSQRARQSKQRNGQIVKNCGQTRCLACRGEEIMKANVESIKVLAAVAVVGLLTIGFAASVQAQSTGLRANIPFEFRVGNTVLPPGTYEVWRSSDALSISDKKGHSAYVMTNGTQKKNKNSTESLLVFNVYGGDKYFLGEVRWSGYPQARLLPKSKVELEVAAATQAAATLSVAAK